MKNKNQKPMETWKKAGCLLLSATLLMNLTACGKAAADETAEEMKEVLNAEEKAFQETITSQLSVSHSNTDGKEETVYILADASGSPEKVIVSDWLKNGEGNSEIADVTDLLDVENVKGDEDFSRDGEQITWKADGADIFYQGISDKEVPVEVRISYTLDGESITPQELAGKSGNVCIRLDYENKTSQKVRAGEKDIEVQVPFAMVSGMILPEDTFSNIQVKNGRLISEGNNTIVVGVAFPGLKESLNLEKLQKESEGGTDGIQVDIDIPDYIEITAEVEDFELGMTMTVALSDLLSSVNSEGGISLDGLKDSMQELGDATEALKDGSVSLEDGSRELAEGTESLVNGVNDLKEGSLTLKNGTQELYEKSGQLDEGAGKLQDGSSQLANGAGQLADGAGQLSDGAQTLANGLGQLDAGVKTLQAALETGNGNQTAILTGSQSVADAASALNTLINEYFTTYETQLNTVIDAVLQQINSTNAALTAAQEELASAEAERDVAKAALDQACQGEVQQIETVTGITQSDSVSGGDSVVTEVTTEVSSLNVCQPEALKSAADAYGNAEAQVAACQANVSALEEKAAGLQAQLAQLQALLKASTPLTDDASSTKGAYIALIKTYSGQLANGASMLNNGLKQLDAGVQQLNSASAGVPALKAGAQSLQAGIDTVKGGAGELKAGAETLGSGTTELKDGTTKLVEGARTLNDGAGTLKDGVGTLYDGAVTLEDGMLQLSDGCLTLKDGLFQFDEEGISKLVALADGDTQEVLDRLKAVADAGKEYKTFTSLSDGMDGSVKFIIKTDGVKAE